MEEYFFLKSSLPKWGKKTFVNWNKKPAENAVVFIHGFNGSSNTTFGEITTKFQSRREYQNYDVFFYGYDSLFRQISNSGFDFLDFLNVIHDNLRGIIGESKMRVQRHEPYKKIVIVAHSLGAVVARYALNEAHTQQRRWVDKCNLVLFAPAHKGARDEILLFSFPGPLGLISPAVRFFIVTVKQLMQKDIIITPLEDRCKELIDSGILSFTTAKKVVWANSERVVINNMFLKDAAPQRFDQTHISICKPNKIYTEPYKVIADVL